MVLIEPLGVTWGAFGFLFSWLRRMLHVEFIIINNPCGNSHPWEDSLSRFLMQRLFPLRNRFCFSGAYCQSPTSNQLNVKS